MPQPVYIVCCSDFLEDKTTSLVTLVKVIESVQIQQSEVVTAPDGTKQVKAAPSLMVWAVAVWLGEESDAEGSFEHLFTMELPGQPEQSVGEPTEFEFQGTGRMMRRFIARMRGFPPVDKSGTCIFKSIIRRPGSDDTSVQRFPFLLQVPEAPTEESEQQESRTESPADTAD